MAEVRALQDVGQFAASIEELNDVLARDPDLPEANYRLGLALVQTGEPSRAVWPLQKAAESSGYQISAGVLLASTLFQTKNFDAAIQAADDVLEADPSRQAAMRIRANAHLAARRPDAAYEDTARLVELFPDDYGVRALHATVLGALGRLEEAERAHQLLKEMGARSDQPALASRACLAPAIFANDVLEDAEKARRLYEECAADTPTDTVVLNHLVGFFDAVGDAERGTSLWREAALAAPEKLEVHRGLAMRLQSQGREQEAEAVLREAVDRFDSAAAWGLLASFHRGRSEPERALEAIEKVVALSGGADDRVRFIEADVLIDLGELERASEVSEALTQPVYANLLRGRIHLARGEPAEALAEFEEGIRAWPNNAGARFLAGIAARDLGDMERAVSELREAVRANNAETDAAVELARIQLDLGRYEQAVTFASMALRGRKGVRQPEPYAIAARALGELGQPVRARRWLDSMEKQGFAREALGERMILEARVGHPGRAVALATESGRDLSAPEHLSLLAQVVEAEVDSGDAESALARIDRALARSPESARLHTLRGVALAGAGRPAEARPAFEGALELEPREAEAHAGLGALDAGAGDFAAAVEHFDRAHELAPQNPHYAYSAAQLVVQSGDIEEGERRLRRIVDRHPRLTGARNDLAWLLAERGRELDFALQLASEARRRDPSPTVADTLGWVHYQRRDYQKAVEVLSEAADQARASPSLHYRLGLALQQVGEEKRAREMFERALASGPFPEEEDARQQLSQLAGS